MKRSIEEVAKEAVPQISILGIGGAGCNVVTWMMEKEVGGARIIALNSDAQHLEVSNADKKVLLGYKITGGLGCGGYPEKGVEAAIESLDDIRTEIAGSNLVFVTAGLGGGTGTGASPVAAKAAREMGALAIGVVTIPFPVEKARMIKSKEGLKRLSEECDAVVVIDNDRLRRVAGYLPLKEAFAVANELIATFIKNLAETIALPSLVNMDFADLRAIMMGGGICAIGVGEGAGDNKVRDAVEAALNAQLLDIGDLTKAGGALIHVEGGDDITLDEVNRAAELVIKRISPKARTSWGARVNSALTGSVRVTVVLTGIESPFLVKEVAAAPVPEVKRKGFFQRIFGGGERVEAPEEGGGAVEKEVIESVSEQVVVATEKEEEREAKRRARKGE